jgi:hypothetical protein
VTVRRDGDLPGCQDADRISRPLPSVHGRTICGSRAIDARGSASVAADLDSIVTSTGLLRPTERALRALAVR